ncbi:MAG: SMC family ATPase [Microbacterium sp.]
MKLHRLELQAFGPFRERQTVDFDAFDADGLFLISGRTGAGKSSILDGVCYALYGTAPRYDGGDRGLRSDHSDPDEVTEVRLEFTAGGARWRVTRTPEYERPKARGAGTTIQKSTVLVEQGTGDGWVGRATKHREAAEVLDGILGLNRDQFQQVILLAQNRFAEFLLAKNDDRQSLLRTLFGSRRYEEYEKALEQRRRIAQQALDSDSATLHALLAYAEALIAENDLHGHVEPDAVEGAPQPVTARIETIDRAVPRAKYRADESARRRDDAQTAHDQALAAYGERSALRRQQEERLASRAAFAALEEQTARVAEDQTRLDRARTAEALRAPIESAERARVASARAEAAEQRARSGWISTGEQDADAPALRAIADVIAGELAVWAAAEELEKSLPVLEARLARAGELVAAIEASIDRLAGEAAARAARIAEIDPELADAEAAAPPVAPARATLDAAVRQLEAGVEAARLAPLAREAESAHLSAVGELERATTAVRTLLQRRLDGYAGELASGLVDDEPCPVCGALEHPHPAAPSDTPVTHDAIALAEAAVEAATTAARRASERARDARRLHQEASARAGGESLERLEARHADAQVDLTRAVSAAAAVAALKTELHGLRDAERAAAVQGSDLTVRSAAAREERAALAQESATVRTRVDAARGEYAAVADRVAAGVRRRDLARALANAADEAARLRATARAEDADLDRRIADSAFADAEEASAALLDAGAQTALAASIRRHEIAFAGERDRLLGLETALAGAPEELVDLDAAGDAASLAREAWNVSVTASAHDAQLATQLSDAASRASAAHASSAGRTAEYELIAGLAGAVAGRTDSRMDLETFVLAAELEEIVAAANLRLDSMSSGRYRLQHSDAVGKHKTASGLGLSVLDAYTGQPRPAQSLSGGETFLASLALALGLAEVVTARAGGVRLDTLFIDEGFGSLDDETLDLAMRTLDELRQGGRTVGLISHVATMKEQLPAQLIVEATPQGPSVIRQDAGIPV